MLDDFYGKLEQLGHFVFRKVRFLGKNNPVCPSHNSNPKGFDVNLLAFKKTADLAYTHLAVCGWGKVGKQRRHFLWVNLVKVSFHQLENELFANNSCSKDNPALAGHHELICHFFNDRIEKDDLNWPLTVYPFFQGWTLVTCQLSNQAIIRPGTQWSSPTIEIFLENVQSFATLPLVKNREGHMGKARVSFRDTPFWLDLSVIKNFLMVIRFDATQTRLATATPNLNNYPLFGPIFSDQFRRLEVVKEISKTTIFIFQCGKKNLVLTLKTRPVSCRVYLKQYLHQFWWQAEDKNLISHRCTSKLWD